MDTEQEILTFSRDLWWWCRLLAAFDGNFKNKDTTKA